MKKFLDTHAFAMALKYKRGDRTLREISIEVGIPHTTLHRFEIEDKKPSVDHFLTLLGWLDLPMNIFVRGEAVTPLPKNFPVWMDNPRRHKQKKKDA